MRNGEAFRRTALLLVLPAGTWLLLGCEKQEMKGTPPAGQATPAPATQPATPAAARTDGTDTPLADLTGEARRAAQTQPAMPPDALPGLPAGGVPAADATGARDTGAIPGIPAAGTPAAPGASTTAPSSPAGEKTAEAQKLLDQAMQYIKENKYDLAEKALNQLDGMKSSLPPEWAGRIDTARKALNTAKAGGGVKLPEGLPGLQK